MSANHVLTNLPDSLPALTALATVIAAGIGAIVAVVVAIVNAWSARRIAIDVAHRDFRSDLAASAVRATRELLALIHQLEQISRQNDVEVWLKAVGRINDLTRRRAKLDLRTPHDEVFAQALTVFKQRRAQFELWLRIRGSDRPPNFGLTVAAEYVREAAELVQVAAEAYVFNQRQPRRRAQSLLRRINSQPLHTRINVRLSAYDAAFLDDRSEDDINVEAT